MKKSMLDFQLLAELNDLLIKNSDENKRKTNMYTDGH